MAYYGIPSAGLALTASTANDTVAMANLGGTLITAQSVFGGDGNDIISLAAVGRTAVGNATFSGEFTDTGAFSGTLSAQIQGSSTMGTGITLITGGVTTGTTFTTSVSFTTAITSQQAARTVNAALLQGNAGNDSIALGDSLTRVSAATFAGGQGNDIIGGFTNVNNRWTGVNVDAIFVNTNIEGGQGNDTVQLQGDAVYSALNINANQGNDFVDMTTTVSGMSKSIIGLGQGNDIFSGEFNSVVSSTIAGGLGNDSITISGTTIDNVIIGGDRANADNIEGDGNDSITINSGVTDFTGSTIYGGGGNDTITFSDGADMTASIVSLNQGKDSFVSDSGTIIKDSTIGLGNQGDIFNMSGEMGSVLSSRLNLGKGLDSTYFGGRDVASGALYAATTMYGGLGADYLLGDATMSGGTSLGINLEYLNNNESTLSAFDTVAVDAAGSGTYVFRYEPGATLASFSAAGVTGGQGKVVFSSNFATDLTARVEAIAANTTDGQAAAFVDGSNQAYLFVKGSTDNLVVQVGSAALSGAGDIASLTVNASKNVNFNIENG